MIEPGHATEPQPRRMGVPGSFIRSLMLYSAEVILCKEGYAALTNALARHPDAATASPDALVLLRTSLAHALNRETVIGIGSGRGEAAKLVSKFLDRIEP